MKLTYRLIKLNPKRESVWKCKFDEKNTKTFNTPLFFPVLSFYCGGRWKAFHGGGIYRAIKEKIVKDKVVKGMYSLVLTSVSQLQDFNLNETQLSYYFQKSIKEWFGLNSVLFVDSGGFKLLGSKRLRKDLYSPERVLNFQLKFGADIIVPLDYPLDIGIRNQERKKRMKITIKNAISLLRLVELENVKNVVKFLPIHGHSREELSYFLSTFLKELDKEGLEFGYEGIAIGSLVPHAMNGKKLISLLLDVRKVLEEFGFYETKPIHVFGISASLIPAMSFLVDSFDSSSYLMSAIHGVIYDEKFRRYQLDGTFTLGKLKKGYVLTKYRKIDTSVIALHNLEVMLKEVKFIREHDENEILKRYAKTKLAKKFLKMVI